MIDTYRRLLFTHGYQAASLFCYLVNMADEEGRISLSTRQITKLTDLSIRQVRTMLQIFNSEHLTEHLAEHLGTIVTICNYDSYRVSKRGKRNTSRNTTKNTPFLPPLDVSPIPPSLSPPIIPQESTIHQSACERFEAWLSEHCPYIRQHYKMMTEAELGKLKQQYGAELIAETCSDIENRIDLRKRYSHLYRTLLNWLKKRNENNRTNHPTTTKEQRLQSAYGLMQRMAAEDGITLS